MRCFTLLVLLLASPALLSAQSTAAVGGFAGHDASVPGFSALAGLSGTWYWRGPVAVRGSGAIGLNTYASPAASGVDPAGVRPWSVDADVLIVPDRSDRASAPIGAIDPYLFVGLGARTGFDITGAQQFLPTWSYGGGVSWWMSERVRIDTEARRRSPITRDANAIAADFRGGWDLRLGVGVHFGTRFAGRAAPIVASPPPAPARPSGANAAAKAGRAEIEPLRTETLAMAEEHLGVPYVWGGAAPEPGFDCSGFVQYVYRRAGVELPRPSRIMAKVGEPLPAEIDSLMPGDLMFFSQDGTRITHVAIYAGGNEILHATGSGGGVGYDDLTTPRGQWFAERFVSASRVLGVPVFRSRSLPIGPEERTEQNWDMIDTAPPGS